MAKTQWHPAFAELLKLLLRDYYEVQTEVTVSELPRAGDVLLVRRQGTPEPPFRHLWKHLGEWNVIEFKGMSDDASGSDLELLVHVGTGLTHKFNEQRREQKLPPLRNFNVAFWLVAPTIGETIREELQGKSRCQPIAEGVWRADAWGHPLFLVSVKDLPHEVDGLPLLLLREPIGTSLAGLFAGNKQLIERMARWLYLNRPLLWKEIRAVDERLKIDWDEVVKSPDTDDIVRAMPVDRVVGAIGADKVIQSIGAEKVIECIGPEKAIEEALALMTPEQAARFLQSKMPRPDAPAPPPTPDSDQGRDP